MSARIIVFASLAVCIGCSSKEAPRQPPRKEQAEVTSLKPEEKKPRQVATGDLSTSQAASPSAAGRLSDEEKATVLTSEQIVSVSLLSPRSFSLKLQLKSGIKAVFKPIRKDDGRARFEVAAYRIARLIEVEQVPAASMREIPAAFLALRLNLDNKETAVAFKDALPKNPSGRAKGAMIEWMEDIDPKGLEHFGGMSAVDKLLAPGRPDNGQEPLAAKASAMVVFDHLIGNWDRFSGGNFFVSKDGLSLILIDHNGSFLPWPDKRKERMEKRLDSTERFSSSLIDRIRGLCLESVRDAVKSDASFGPLLTDEEINLLLQRRDEILRHVDRLMKKNGLANTLAFP
jgi:hypothetical protein